MKKILILAANPRKDLNLSQEIRDLTRLIERSQNKEQFEVIPELAVQVESLQDLLLKHQPQIVHFCGHGSGEQGLVFENERGGEHWVGTEALANLFQLFEQKIECVLLNACYSEKQANAIVEHINYVIGMNQAIQDDAAIAFSKGFYRALGYNCSIDRAYKFGCNAIQLEISGSSRKRSANTEVERKLVFQPTLDNTTIPEHLKPILKIKPFFANSSNFSSSTPSEEIQMTLLSEIDDSLKKKNDQDLKTRHLQASFEDAKDQYRQEVKRYINRGKITFVGRKILDTLIIRLGLTELEAKTIENEILNLAQQEFPEKLKHYEQSLIKAFQQTIPLKQSELDFLRQNLKQYLGLTDEDIEPIEMQIQANHELYKQHLQEYEEVFIEAITQKYPLTKEELKQYQKVLGIGDEDVVRIETQITSQYQARSLVDQNQEEISPVLDSVFLEHCQQNLTHFIGPIASFIVQDILAQNPTMSPKQLIDILSAKIPDPQKAEQFKKRLS